MNLVIDILLVGILLLYFFRGWNNGLVYALVNVAGVVGSYVLAVISAPLLSPYFSEKFEVAKIIGYLLGWTLVFLVVVLVFWIIKRTALKNLAYHKLGEEGFHLSLASQLLGGTISLFLGTVVVAISILLYGTMSGGLPSSKLPDISGSKVVDASSMLSRRVAYAGIKKATGNKNVAEHFARVLSNPHRTMSNIRKIAGSTKFRRVVSDEALLDAAVKGRELDVVNNMTLNAMLADKALMKSMYQLGVVNKEPDYNYLSLDFRYKLAHELVVVAQKIDKAGDDSVIKKRMTELRHAGMLKKSNLDKLIKDERFHEVLDQLFFSDQVVDKK